MSPEGGAGRPVSRLAVILAFAAVYVLWGSTYLAILFTLETMPPFLMAGARFLVAGVVVYLYCRLRGTRPPSLAQWRSAFVIGGLLLLGGNGAVVWAELRISSGLAALLVSSVPIWMVLLEWVRPRGNRPSGLVLLALVLGFIGVAILIGPGNLATDEAFDRLGSVVVLFGALCWAVGSIASRTAPQPESALLVTGMRMIGGGVLLGITGTVCGEWPQLSVGDFSLRSWLALAYLIVFGSIVAFSCYIWLLRVSTPARVGTYAYVNPVVAVMLGWLLAGEALTPRILWGSLLIVGSVMLITVSRPRPRPRPVCPEGSLSRAT